MSATLMIIINAVLDAAILGGLAIVMSRSSKLTPHHQSRLAERHVPHVQSGPEPGRARRERASGRVRPAFD